MNKAITYGLVAAYLGVVIAANLVAAHWGASASIYVAFFFIAFSLTAKDRLQDVFGEHRFQKMALLILSGSALSFGAAHLIHGAAPPDIIARVALASGIAFLVSEAFDAVVYELMRKRPWLERSNASNIVGSALDSIIFVSVAFSWQTSIVFGQWTAKIAGGVCVSLALRYLTGKDLHHPLAEAEAR